MELRTYCTATRSIRLILYFYYYLNQSLRLRVILGMKQVVYSGYFNIFSGKESSSSKRAPPVLTRTECTSATQGDEPFISPDHTAGHHTHCFLGDQCAGSCLSSMNQFAELESIVLASGILKLRCHTLRISLTFRLNDES